MQCQTAADSIPTIGVAVLGGISPRAHRAAKRGVRCSTSRLQLLFTNVHGTSRPGRHGWWLHCTGTIQFIREESRAKLQACTTLTEVVLL